MKKILVIDDDKNIIENIYEILSGEGYEVKLSYDGRQGFNTAMEWLPDLIICDIFMPELNGLDVIKLIKKNQYTRNIPFIFLTAKSELKDFRVGMDYGADDYIFKPFKVEELTGSVKTRFLKLEFMENKINGLINNLKLSLPHELRTPLVPIIGFTDLLIENYDYYSKEDVINFLKNINTAGNKIHRIVENYLYLTSLEIKAQNGKGIKKPNESSAILTYKVLNDISQKIMETYNRFDDLIINHIEDYEIEIGENDLIKILEEIIDNAFKFSEKGQKVFIYSSEESDYITIKVSNQGRGMTEEQIMQIMPNMQFERSVFEQPGLGLGLYIAKKIIETYKGKLIISPGENTIHLEIKLPKKKNGINISN